MKKKNRIIDTLIDSGMITEGAYIVTGVSGGPDSLCLLHALAQLADAYDLTIVPVHIDHQLRAESADEAANVERICEKLGLECNTFEADCRTTAKELGVSEEEAGRIIRYEIFDEVASGLEDEGVPESRIMIALAHNADDQSETVLFRLLRGTGLHGLGGIPAARRSEAGYMIIRPLLLTERSEIEQYIRDNRLRPNIDRTNSENTYTRNRIRNELIPYLEKNYNPNIKEALRKFAAIADMDDSLLTEIALTAMDENVSFDEEHGRVLVALGELKHAPLSITTRISSAVLELLGISSGASYELVTAVTSMIYTENPSASIDLPGGYRARREYDTLIFSEADEQIMICADESLKMFPQVMMMREFRPDEEGMYAAFDFDSFDREHPGKVGEITLRTRREGDFIPMKNGSKKIQDLLVDSKVMKNARDSILLVAIDSEVLWVLPSKYFSGRQEREKGRFSPKYHITDKTERVLYIEIADIV